ncbi:MAG: TonB-dependent receptor [Methylovulum sp.]|nr:TonB-dependent receptor [Methylovulum sp.]
MDAGPNLRKTPLAISIFMLSMVNSAPGFAEPDGKTFKFNIPAKDMSSALLAFSETTDIQLSYPAQLVKGVQSQPLSGTYTPKQALDKLLGRSPIAYRFADDNVIALQTETGTPKAASPETNADSPTLKPVKVTAAGLDESEDTPYNTSYNRSNASSATKTDTPIMETPISVQVVPRAVIQDQQAVQVGDAIKNVSGVFQGFSLGGFAEQFMIRGFNTQYNNYVDGFSFPVSRISLANAERIEVVKGAAANLYGRIEPGGLINVVTKRPQATPYYALEQQFGSFDLYRTTADATGAINADGSLMYRVNLESLNKRSFRDYGFTDRVFLAPSVTWKIGDRTQIDLDFLYSDEDTQEDWGIPADTITTHRPINIPISRYLGEPSTDKTNTSLTNTAITLAHAFTDDWKVRARFNYFTRDVLDQQTAPPPFGFDEVGGDMLRFFYGTKGVSDTYHGTVNLTGHFKTLDVEHDVLVGWEHYSGDSTRDNAYGYFFQGTVNGINVYNPQYNPSNIAQIYADPANHDFNNNNGSNSNGIIFQDQIILFEKLHILGGGRYDWATQINGYGLTAAEAATNRPQLDNERFNPRVGLLYQAWDWLSLYGNYVESMGALNNSTNLYNNLLPPEIGEQYEAGFKTSFFDGRLTSSVAFYQLTKKNLAVGAYDSVTNRNYSRAIGEARSQGVEIDMSGQITDGLSMIASYAYTDAVVTKGAEGSDSDVGKRLWDVPRNAGSLWLKYDLQQAVLRGLSVGAGAYFQDQRQGDITNDYQLPGYGRVDALVKYQLPVAKAKTTLQFNIENLLDHRYYAASSPFNSNSVIPGAPRTFMGSVKVEF